MFTTLGWVLVGFTIYALCILLQALQNRFAPEWGDSHSSKKWWDELWGTESDAEPQASSQKKDAEIDALKKRVEVLEAIVTDKRYQFDEELKDA